MFRQAKIAIYALSATAVSYLGWIVLLFGGILYLVFGEQGFPRAAFWAVSAISIPIFLAFFVRYFNRVEK